MPHGWSSSWRKQHLPRCLFLLLVTVEGCRDRATDPDAGGTRAAKTATHIAGTRAPASSAQATTDEALVRQRIDSLLARVRRAGIIEAVDALGELARIGEPAVAPLVRMTAEDRSYRGYFAAGALGDMGGDAEAAVPSLIAALEGAEIELASACLDALGKIRRRRDASLPALTRALADPRAEVRPHAAAAALAFDPSQRDAVAALIAGLRAPDHPDLRAFAAERIGARRPPAPEARAALVVALADPYSNVTCAALDALAQYGRDARDAVGAMTRLLQHPNLSVRSCAILALGAMGPVAAGAVAPLEELLGARRMPEEGATADEVADAGPESHAFYRNLAIPAATALLAIDAHHAAAAALLAAALRDARESQWDRLDAAAALADRMAEPRAFALLVELAHDRDLTTRREAGRALARNGHAEGIAALVEALAFDNDVVRVTAAKTLADLGPAGIEALPALERAANDLYDAPLRRAARDAIAAIRGRADARAVPAPQPPDGGE